jgi:bifunctional NMN adenylyltransferase/nudix hydrolase
MSTKSFEYSIFIGRFQPFHMAHYALLQEALKLAQTAIVVIGSHKRSPSPKHPFSGEEREAMMRASLTPEENERVKVIYMHDYLYNDSMWLADAAQKVSEATNDSESIILVGHDHDDTSYYLQQFPQWEKKLISNLDHFPHATEIRYLYFTHDVSYQRSLHPKTMQYMEDFKKTPKFKGLKAYFDAIRASKTEWAGAPYPPIFHTVDTVVIKSGHVLCVRRGKAYGGGQIALPGGFLNERELIRVGAIRELKEETAIALDKRVLDSAIRGEHTFDHPDRSERGRTITTAFFVNLDLVAGPLPKVKGSDDADKAWWMPLNEFYSREEEFFEDHYHIINYFVGSPMMRAA